MKCEKIKYSIEKLWKKILKGFLSPDLEILMPLVYILNCVVALRDNPCDLLPPPGTGELKMCEQSK